MSFNSIPASIPPSIPLPSASTPFPFSSVALEVKNPVASCSRLEDADTIPPNDPSIQEFSHNSFYSTSQHPNVQFYEVRKALEDQARPCDIPLAAIGSSISPFISECQEPRILSLETMPVPNEPNTIGLGPSSTFQKDAFISDGPFLVLIEVEDRIKVRNRFDTGIGIGPNLPLLITW